MAEKTGLRKLLILHGPALEAQGAADLFREYYDVRVVQDLDEALAAMREEPFDAILAETADFLPLERGAVTQQAAVVLDTIGDGVCIAGPEGDFVWANRRLRGFPPAVLDGLRQLCAKAFQEFSSSPAAAMVAKRFTLMPPDGSYYEVLCSPVRDRHDQLRQVAAVVVNATSHRRQQLKLNAIDRAGRELVRLDDATWKADATARLKVLEERIIRCSKDVLDYQHFAVLLLNSATNALEMIVSQGLPPDTQKYELFARTEGNGICGYVAATGRSYICSDVLQDGLYLPGLHGARSSLTVPLRLHDKVIGVLNVESDRTGAFGEEDRQFAEIFANYVAVALHILNLLVFERHTTRSQLSGSICAELSGPLNDVLTEADSLMEDYIGMDDLRKRLGTIIDSATRATKCLNQISQGAAVIGFPATEGPDPVLSGKMVLVADDEEVIRETIANVLLGQGCLVDQAADGAEACEKISRGHYDLVVSDIKMPGASGYDVFAATRKANPAARVVLMTAFGYDPNHSILKANKEGLAAVLMKPFKVRQLVDGCRTALAQSE